MPRFEAPTEASKALRRAGRAEMMACPTGRYADRGQWLRAGAFALLLTASYGLLLFDTGVPALMLAALAGLGGFGILMTVCHDASHGAMSRHGWVNRALLTGGFALFGISGQLWGWRHVRLHHMFPNVAGMDIDGEGSLLVRLAPHRPWYWWHGLQVLYAPLLYSLVFAHLTWIDDWRHRRMGLRLAPQKFRRVDMLAEFIGAKLFHALIAVVLPLSLLDITVWEWLVGYWIAMGLPSLLFILLAAGTHLSEEAEFVDPDGDEIGHDWAAHQLRTAVDWAPASPLAVALTGGANAHAAHHLFPEAAHCLAPRLTRLVADHAARTCTPHHVTSFAGMLRAHIGHLRSMGRRPMAT